jgi:hypothetical protein
MDTTRLKFASDDIKVNKKSRTLTVTISTKTPDRSRDVVMPRGMKTDNYMKNPVVAFGHDYRGLAIAKAGGLDVTDDRIIATVQFPDEGVYPFADQVYKLYRDGFMNAWSIGFMPLKALDLDTGGRQFDEWELLEFSAVLVPDNPEALTMFRSTKGLDMNTIPDVQTVLETKTVIPYKDLGTADVEAEWDGAGEIASAEISDLKLMATWFDAENPDVKTSYKLPHHKATGGNPAVLRGVYAAMGALLGARGGVTIPESDRKGIYNHLAKHYAQYDVAPPEFKTYEQSVIDDLFKEYHAEIDAIIKCSCDDQTPPVKKDATDSPPDDTKSGRVLSQKTRKQINSALDTIKSLNDAFGAVTSSLTNLLEASDNSDSQPDKTVVDLAEGLKIADKAIGLVLRKLNEQRS